MCGSQLVPGADTDVGRFGFLIPIVFGVVAALGHAPLGWWPATLVGLTAGFWWALKATTTKQAMWAGWLLALGYFTASLNWLVEPFFVDAARHAWMAPFAPVLMSAGLALFWCAAMGFAHAFAGPRWRWLALALALTGGELARGRVLTGFPWASPGHVWIDTPFAQLAMLIGASGLSALTFLIAAVLARAVLLRGQYRMQCAFLASAGVVAVALLSVAIDMQRATLPQDQDIIVRLVQPNAPQHLKWDPDHAYKFVARQVEFTAAPAQGGRAPDLILWPETAVPTLLDWAGGAIEDMKRAANGVPVLFGVQRGDGLRYYNSLALLGADGEIQATYDKHHLVPFGEYIPFGDALTHLGVNAFASQLGNGYSAGAKAQVLDLGRAGRVLPLICYEAIFPEDLRAAPERANWILHATNDAWFGGVSMPFQHLDIARFRAIEFGLPVIRVANTGVSAVIDVTGALRASLPLNSGGFLDARIPGFRDATPYSRHGDQPLTLLVLVALGTFAGALVTRRRSKTN